MYVIEWIVSPSYDSREYLTPGYGLRLSTDVCGNKWEKMVFHENLKETCFGLAGISESTRKPPGSYVDNVI